MTAGTLRLLGILLSGVVFLLGAACGTTAPTRFYLMIPMADSGQGVSASNQNDVTIALASVELPEHLNRPQIVTRQDGHHVKVDDFNRWAEPLKQHVNEILAENLSLLLDTEGIIITNRHKQVDVDFHLAVKILRFDGWPGKEATLDCRWYLGKGEEFEATQPERFTVTRPVGGSDYADLVATLSRMLADLSREIAEEIKAY